MPIEFAVIKALRGAEVAHWLVPRSCKQVQLPGCIEMVSGVKHLPIIYGSLLAVAAPAEGIS